MSTAWPETPPHGWWIRMREEGSATRLPVRPAGQEQRAHGGGLAEADRLHVRLDVLDGVVDGQPGGHRSARRVDVEVDVLLRVLRLEEQELRHDEVRVHVVDLAVHEHDAVLEEARVDVVGPLAASGLFDDDGNEAEGGGSGTALASTGHRSRWWVLSGRRHGGGKLPRWDRERVRQAAPAVEARAAAIIGGPCASIAWSTGPSSAPRTTWARP